jgi:hypothetical protein
MNGIPGTFSTKNWEQNLWQSISPYTFWDYHLFSCSRRKFPEMSFNVPFLILCYHHSILLKSQPDGSSTPSPLIYGCCETAVTGNCCELTGPATTPVDKFGVDPATQPYNNSLTNCYKVTVQLNICQRHLMQVWK